MADHERLDAEGVAELLVFVFGVAEDEGAVAEVHHPQAERFDGAGLAASGFAEREDVRVRDRDRVVEHPAVGVGVKRSAGQVVDPHLGAGGWQAARSSRNGRSRPV
ncbi:MAG: hypothetical protein IPO80_04775 [Propionibacteriaceae bacterium]|nr:hypothetical protein [Propionibacteriaceae bacterium]